MAHGIGRPMAREALNRKIDRCTTAWRESSDEEEDQVAVVLHGAAKSTAPRVGEAANCLRRLGPISKSLMAGGIALPACMGLASWSADALAQKSVPIEADAIISDTRDMGTDASTVGKWRRRFAECRLDGLYDEPRSGAPRKIGDEEIAEIVARPWRRRRPTAGCVRFPV